MIFEGKANRRINISRKNIIDHQKRKRVTQTICNNNNNPEVS